MDDIKTVAKSKYVKNETGWTPVFYDERVIKAAKGECPVCGEREPSLTEIMTGEYKGCIHYQKSLEQELKHCPSCGKPYDE